MKKIFIFVFLILICFLHAELQDSEISVSSDIVGENFDFVTTISTSDLLQDWNVISFQFSLYYDPTIIEYIDYSTDGTISSMGSVAVNSEVPGELVIGYMRLTPYENGGDLLDLTFTGISVGNSTLDIEGFTYNSTEISNLIDGEIIVIPSNHPPEIMDEIDNITVDEDFDNVIEINLDDHFSDIDGDDLIYSFILGEEIISAEIIGNYFYATSIDNLNGETIVAIIADDGFEYVDRDIVEDSFLFTVQPINDPPVLISNTPDILEFEIIAPEISTFSVDVEDIDSQNLVYSWFIDTVDQQCTDNTFAYEFPENGIYSVKCVFSDGEFDDEVLWNVTVNITGILDDVNDPNIISLQNYPNPFNPTTSISFSVLEPSYVKLEIFNIRGQKIQTLVDEFIDSPTYKLDWHGIDKNGEKVSSGQYYMQLKMDNIVITKKIMILK